MRRNYIIPLELQISKYAYPTPIPPIVPAGFLPLRLVMLCMILTPVACMDPTNNQDTSSNFPVAKAAITLTSGIVAATVIASRSVKRPRQHFCSNDASPAPPRSSYNHNATTSSVRPRADDSGISGRPVTANRPTNSNITVDIRQRHYQCQCQCQCQWQ
jgi:hypothetical protein